jgi:hypothetical protein
VVRVAAGAGGDVRARLAGQGGVAGGGSVGGGVRLRGGRRRAAAAVPGRPGQSWAGPRFRAVALHPAPELLRRRRGVVRPVAAGVLPLAGPAAGRLPGLHGEHAGPAHRQEAAGEAHDPVQGRRVRRLRAADQRIHPVAAPVRWLSPGGRASAG